MLFLLNDRILDLGAEGASPPLDAERFHALSLDYVLKLGQELFAEAPLLHREEPERARRLALLIIAKAPQVNAAHFQAPAHKCRPDQVSTRLANVAFEVMAGLTRKEKSGDLNPVTADREVWRRMAA